MSDPKLPEFYRSGMSPEAIWNVAFAHGNRAGRAEGAVKLRPWARHSRECEVSSRCICGLDAALSEVKE